MEQPSLTLIDVLQRRLEGIDGAKMLLLTMLDGAELLSVAKPNTSTSNETAQILAQCCNVSANASDQVGKLGLGGARYILSWIDAHIVVQCRLEAAILAILLAEDANLGGLDDQLDVMLKVLQPFTTNNFITANIN